jgi:hypothetical protein
MTFGISLLMEDKSSLLEREQSQQSKAGQMSEGSLNSLFQASKTPRKSGLTTTGTVNRISFDLDYAEK